MDMHFYKIVQTHKLKGNVKVFNVKCKILEFAKCKIFKPKTFKTAGLNRTTQAGLRIFSFLDVQFTLNNGMSQLCRKSDNIFVYINRKSNRKSVVLKQLSKSEA